MPSGEEYVITALALSRDAGGALEDLEDIDETWRDHVTVQIKEITDLLTGVEGRFFVRSKLCLPFARRAAAEAERLSQAMDDLANGRRGAMTDIEEALAALSQAARTLDERSTMQGMSIT